MPSRFQRVGDFLKGQPSVAPGRVDPSYTPGVHWTDLSLCLPDFVITALREALPAFDKQIRGFAMDDAVMTGVETRTSSPIRIKRGGDLQSINTRGLYPAGEGAGYAGGILSAGVDGIKVAEAVARGMLAAQAHAKNLGSPEFHPLYEAAQRLDTPIAVHAFGGDEPGTEIFDQFISIHTTGHPFPVLRQLTAMVFGGGRCC